MKQAPDVHSSAPEYAARFSGAAGEVLLSRQRQVFLEVQRRLYPGGIAGKSVLDVGGGHAQLLPILLAEGAKVTLLASSEEAIGMSQSLVSDGKVTLHTGPLDAGTEPERSYDLVVCFRILPHVDDPQRLLQGLERVAREALIVEYPPLLSVNLVAPLLFWAKKLVEKSTRTFTLFWDHQVARALTGSQRVICAGQFVVPLAAIRLVAKVPAAFKAVLLLDTLCAPLRGILGGPRIVGFKRLR